MLHEWPEKLRILDRELQFEDTKKICFEARGTFVFAIRWELKEN